MPHPANAAAPPPVAPTTFRNRLRSIASASVVAQGAVARHVALQVTIDAPAHLQRGDLIDLRHRTHVAVTVDATVGAQDFDVPHVGEAHESGEGVHADPHGSFLVDPRRLHLLHLGRLRAARARVLGRRHVSAERPLAAADDLVAAEARLYRRDAGLARDGDGAVAVQTRHLVLAGVDIVTKEDGLTWALEPRRIADDGGLEARSRLTGLRGGGDGDRQSDRHTHPDPTTPLRHPERSMATGSLCVWNGSRAPGCSRGAGARTSRGAACRASTTGVIPAAPTIDVSGSRRRRTRRPRPDRETPSSTSGPRPPSARPAPPAPC